MTVMRRSLLGAAMLAAALSCGPSLVDGVFTDAEMTKIKTLSPLPPVPADPTNKYADDPKAATLGQQLFFDPSYAGPLGADSVAASGGLGTPGQTGKVSCASCHVPPWYTDTRSKPNNTTLGAGWTGRNTPSVVNAVFYHPWFFWDGRKDSLWSHALGPPESGVEHNSNRLRICHMVGKKYRTEYVGAFGALDAAFGATPSRFPPDGKPGDAAFDNLSAADKDLANRCYANFGKAIAAYERKIVSRNAPFDKYVAGDRAAVSDSAKRGLKLFIGKAACVECHSGPFFEDHKFHHDGVPQVGNRVPTTDTGRFNGVADVLGDLYNAKKQYSDDTGTGASHLDGLAQAEADRGRFRTKSLREVVETGPYMHTGAMQTLAEVIDHYDKAGATTGFVGTKDPLLKPLNLAAAEKGDLEAFLKTLSGEAIAEELQRDTSKP